MNFILDFLEILENDTAKCVRKHSDALMLSDYTAQLPTWKSTAVYSYADLKIVRTAK